MGFYVNVKAKSGCANQINELWSNNFDGFLIYTPKIIKDSIRAMKKDPEQKALYYINTIKQWNDAIPVAAQNRGQLFLRAYGYSEERADKFVKENIELSSKMKFILDHRMLFKFITNIQDATDALKLELDFDFYEDGKMQNYQYPDFSKMKQLHQNPVFNLCLEHERPDFWQVYLDITENKLNKENWDIIKNKVIPSYEYNSATVWQRCEAILAIQENRILTLKCHIEEKNLPNSFDLLQCILLNNEKFETYLYNIKNKNNINNVNINNKPLKLVS